VTVVIAELYQALRTAGVDETLAAAAAHPDLYRPGTPGLYSPAIDRSGVMNHNDRFSTSWFAIVVQLLSAILLAYYAITTWRQ
jgi:hypothetical protein